MFETILFYKRNKEAPSFQNGFFLFVLTGFLIKIPDCIYNLYVNLLVLPVECSAKSFFAVSAKLTTADCAGCS